MSDKTEKLKDSVKHYNNPTEPVSIESWEALGDSPWVTDGSLPPEGKVVIIEYQGEWPGRGSGGITDAYAWDRRWFNLPSGIEVTKWMYIPE